LSREFCMECGAKVSDWSARFGGNNTIFCKKCFASNSIVQKHVDSVNIENIQLKDQATLSFSKSKTVQKALNEKKIKTEEKHWFYSADLEEQIGPYTISELGDLYNKKEIGKNTLVWAPFLNDWSPFCTILEENTYPQNTNDFKSNSHNANLEQTNIVKENSTQLKQSENFEIKLNTDYSLGLLITNILIGLLVHFIGNSGGYNTSFKHNPNGLQLHLANSLGFILPALFIAGIAYLFTKSKKITVVVFWVSLVISLIGTNA
jgi:uncharacterized protein DUF4339